MSSSALGSAQSESARSAITDSTTILLVDDQEVVRDVSKEVLEELGYRVITATNGLEAVQVYHNNRDHIDLCIMDMMMPKMCGDEAARLIRQSNPQVKIIFATGYDKSRLRGMDGEIVLSKPFPIDELQQVIQQQL